MKVPDEDQSIREITRLLIELLDIDRSEVSYISEHSEKQIDLVLRAGSLKFAIEWKNSSRVGNVRNAIDQVQEFASGLNEEIVPLVAVPFMGEAGRKLCRDTKTAWIDLSGNARIKAPGLKILIDGKPNKFKRVGKPSSIFSPRSSRIVRWLLMHPHESILQRNLSFATEVDEGYTSKIINKMLDDEYVVKDKYGMIQVRNPEDLLDSWYESYEFGKHEVVKGNIAARTGDSLLRMISETFDNESLDYSVTGLGAAWLYSQFARFRIVTVYLRKELPVYLLEKLLFREDPRGANTWFVIPDDQGVFQGSTRKDSINCVHPVQVYLDLKGHPERAKEAAEKLREDYLSWNDHAR